MSNAEARITILNDGLTVVTRYAEAALSTDIAVKVLAGSRDEVAGGHPRGTAHFDEHMVCTGSVKYPQRARDLIESMPGYDMRNGNHFTPATLFYFTNYNASVPAAETTTALKIMGDMLSQPRFGERDVGVQKRYITNEWIDNQISFRSGNLESWVVPRVAHDDNALLYPVIGDKKSIQQITARDVFDFHKGNVTAGRTVIAVEGDVQHDDVVATVQRALVLPAGMRSNGDVPIYTGGDLRFPLPGDGGTHVVLAFKAPPEGDSKASMAFKMMSKLLTAPRGKHSIPEMLGSDEIAVYSHNTVATQMLDTGLFTVTFNAMDVRPCLEAVQRIMYGLTERVDGDAFEKLRQQQHDHIRFAERLFKVGANDMAGDVFLHGQVLAPDHYSRMRLQVTEGDVMAAAKQMLSHPPTLVAAGDIAPLPSMREVRNLFHDTRAAEPVRSMQMQAPGFQGQHAYV